MGTKLKVLAKHTDTNSKTSTCKMLTPLAAMYITEAINLKDSPEEKSNQKTLKSRSNSNASSSSSSSSARSRATSFGLKAGIHYSVYVPEQKMKEKRTKRDESKSRSDSGVSNQNARSRATSFALNPAVHYSVYN